MRTTLELAIAFFAVTAAVLSGADPGPAATTPAAIPIAVAAGFAVVAAVLVFAARAALRLLPWKNS